MTDATAKTIPGDQGDAGEGNCAGESHPVGDTPHAAASAEVNGEPASDRRATDSAVAPGSGDVRRWVLAVLAASVAGMPIGWLLCYGGLLPFYLGLFFFTLFGLLLGAVAYRVGNAARPLSKAAIVAGTAAVVAVTWSISVAVEAYDFPYQVAGDALMQYRRLAEGNTPESFRRQSVEEVRAYLRENHPPGGIIGYVHWAVTSSRIDPPVGALRRPFKASQPGAWWAGRVVLSIILLFYGVYAQVGSLTRLPTERERARAGINPLSKI